jgi:uncharacterized membrane-anchored protein
MSGEDSTKTEKPKKKYYYNKYVQTRSQAVFFWILVAILLAAIPILINLH